MSKALPTETELKRKALFVPCNSKAALHRWIKLFLGLDMPDCIVDPDSNCTPMDLIWEIYDTMRQNNRPDFDRLMSYASRDSYKTMGASILETLAVVHLKRSVAHMAAIQPQAAKAQKYIKAYFNRPMLRDFLTSKNERTIEITRYEHKQTKDVLTPPVWEVLPPPEKDLYEEYKNYIVIVIATPQGANSEHVPFMVIDEVDLIEGATEIAYEEAKLIPAPFQGLLPITLLTSSRKKSYGLVQREIDDASQTGLHIRHWNIIDVTEPCPPHRHLPAEPKIPIYYSDDSLKAISENDWKLLSLKEQASFHRKDGYKGCLLNCKLFAVCQGRLATDQHCRSPLLKPISFVINQFRNVTLPTAQAQLMCRKPSTEGLIYPNLNPEIHKKTAAQMAHMITGEPHPETFTKSDLINLMKSRGVTFHTGMDWGYTHNFAAVTGGLDGNKFFVFDVIAQPELELSQKITVCKEKLAHLQPRIYADPESPGEIKTFTKEGFRMIPFEKKKGSVVGGIEIVRMKLMPAIGNDPQMFFLAGDEGVEFLLKRMSQYHWKADAANRLTDEPDDAHDDECFTENTEVLTGDRGWVSLRDVQGSDSVLAVTATGAGVWDVPDIIQKSYKGPMFTVGHHHLAFTATKNHGHMVMTQYDWKVKKQYRLRKQSIESMADETYWANNLSEWPNGSGLFRQGADEAWVAGFWLAEGCFDKARPTYLLFDQSKEQWKAVFREKIRKLGWRMSESYGQNGHVRFVVSGQKERANQWQTWFGALSHTKKLEVSTIFRMTAAERLAFWEGYMAGDGSRTSSWHFDSVSKPLADGVQLLTLSLGFGCRLVSYNCMRAGRTMTNPQGRTYKARQSYRGHVLRKAPVAHIRKISFVRKEYEGMVYCVRTKTGAFLARTDGKVFVAGNCDAIRYVVMNIFSPKGRVIASKDLPDKLNPEASKQYLPGNYLSKAIREHTGETGVEGDDARLVGKKNTFLWDL